MDERAFSVKYSIIVILGPAGVQFRLSYKTKEARDLAMSAYEVGSNIADDYGQVIRASDNAIHALVETSDDAEIEIALNQGRANEEARKRASTDPMLRAVQQRQSLLTGGGQGIFPQ